MKLNYQLSELSKIEYDTSMPQGRNGLYQHSR